MKQQLTFDKLFGRFSPGNLIIEQLDNDQPFGVIRSVGNHDVEKEDDEDEEEYVQDVEEDGMIDGEEGKIDMSGLENPKCHS